MPQSDFGVDRYFTTEVLGEILLDAERLVREQMDAPDDEYEIMVHGTTRNVIDRLDPGGKHTLVNQTGPQPDGTYIIGIACMEKDGSVTPAVVVITAENLDRTEVSLSEPGEKLGNGKVDLWVSRPKETDGNE